MLETTLRLETEMSNKFVYIFKNTHGMLSVVNYDSENRDLNNFLSVFDGWGGNGIPKESNGIKTIWFEMPIECFEMLKSETFTKAFQRMGVVVLETLPRWTLLSSKERQEYKQLRESGNCLDVLALQVRFLG